VHTTQYAEQYTSNCWQVVRNLDITLIPGRNEDVVVWVQGGIHGDEQEAVLAVERYRQLARRQPPPVSLKVLCPANGPGFAARSRVAPEDGLDLNRCFPGSLDGPATRQAAAAIWAEVVTCHGAVDIHSSSDILVGVPHAIVQEGSTRLHQVGRAAGVGSGLPVLWSSKGSWLTGSLIHAAASAGIPSCLLDIGSSPPWGGREGIETMMTAVLEVYAAAARGTQPTGDGQAPVPRHEIGDPSWVESPVTGWLVSVQEPGSMVEPGATLAVVWAGEGEDHPLRWDGPGPGLVVTVRAQRDVAAGTPLVSVVALEKPT
jgi:predicted deacylase